MFYFRFKRLYDFIFALLGIILLSPLFLIIIILIKLDSTGPIFFRQKRIGRNKTTFTILKFRTMKMETPRIHQLTCWTIPIIGLLEWVSF